MPGAVATPSPVDERAILVEITDHGLALFNRVLPGHVQVVRRLPLDPLSGDDLHHLGDIVTRVRDHMRTQPPRSAAPRNRRPRPAAPPPAPAGTGTDQLSRPGRAGFDPGQQGGE